MLSLLILLCSKANELFPCSWFNNNMLKMMCPVSFCNNMEKKKKMSNTNSNTNNT